LEPEIDIKIEYIGLRPGEKLYEELITEGEGLLPTQHGKIMVLSGDACDLNTLTSQIEKLRCLAEEQDHQGILNQLIAIVPEYRPAVNSSSFSK
jgi:FlaA1/EpsC-like NDP-sugar epimerase